MIVNNIEKTKTYWASQGIFTHPGNEKLIKQLKEKINLPDDFVRFYSCLNGMGLANETDGDSNGFLFYALEEIINAGDQFKNGGLFSSKKNIFIFVDYLQKSWFYGIEIFNKDLYNIVIVPHKYKYKIITNSLDEFLMLYLEDSSVLYDYDV